MILGVDIGKKYALCKLQRGVTPEISFLDSGFLSGYLYEIDKLREPLLVVYEKVNANSQFGVKSCFQFGYELGWFEALLGTITVAKREVVAPLKWKNALNVHSKGEAIDFVRSRYDERYIIPKGGKVANHNMADSVCIAHYGALSWEGYL